MSSFLVFSASGGRANSFEVPVNLVVGESNVNLGLTDTIGTVSQLLSCQARVTMRSCFVYKVIRDL